MLKTITAQKARVNLGEIINKVYFGNWEFIVERKGLPMVKIIRINIPGRTDSQDAFMRFAGSLDGRVADKMKTAIARARKHSDRKIPKI